jgi:transcriptional regulator with XRE-family HTH domain
MTRNRTGSGGGDLRSRRIAAGLTQQRVADLAGCSISIVGLLERGLTPEHSSVIPRILAVLDGQEIPARKESPAGQPSSHNISGGVGTAGHVSVPR